MSSKYPDAEMGGNLHTCDVLDQHPGLFKDERHTVGAFLDKSMANVLSKADVYQVQMGVCQRRVMMLRKTVGIRRRVLGPTHSPTVQRIYLLSTSLLSAKQSSEAEKNLRFALEWFSEARHLDDERTLFCFLNLNASLQAQGQVRLAEICTSSPGIAVAGLEVSGQAPRSREVEALLQYLIQRPEMGVGHKTYAKIMGLHGFGVCQWQQVEAFSGRPSK
ncbi:predicted protein [Verticillium alfalfae VaMs.102]|uniref:Predicted protein n=1 Tax=Verticillium alfalfae (strain VaMs.102 / ATCC MYA-4576 / FGSC 10136) TaxID=526221 RepID=C9SPW8_VERA1|nr:predicted protein [Verticillium alfalfae VaMs.102]EEY20833.1 predicted protein [Verticillium alfalfae VaMs.102]